MSKQEFICFDNIAYLKTLADNSIDSVVTDAPYGLGKEPNVTEMLQAWITTGYLEVSGSGFMGKKWDAFVPQPNFWKEVFRVLKPGGYVLCFFGTRTYDWGVMAMRIAYFEIRDCIQWIYGSGFPKSLDVSKAIENKTGDKQQWNGYGTALKPANEPIVLARKPLEKGLTVAENVLKWGTGGINIDSSRISLDGIENHKTQGKGNLDTFGFKGIRSDYYEENPKEIPRYDTKGRFPSNVLLDEESAKVLDAQTGELTSGAMTKSYEYTNNGNSIGNPTGSTKQIHESNSGGASRFFYVAKPSKAERNLGLGKFDKQKQDESRKEGNVGGDNPRNRGVNEVQNFHPTVKPIKLMQYLVNMVTPIGGICIDPFSGSGTTGIACVLEDIEFKGIDCEKDYVDIAEARRKSYGNQQKLF